MVSRYVREVQGAKVTDLTERKRGPGTEYSVSASGSGYTRDPTACFACIPRHTPLNPDFRCRTSGPLLWPNASRSRTDRASFSPEEHEMHRMIHLLDISSRCSRRSIGQVPASRQDGGGDCDSRRRSGTNKEGDIVLGTAGLMAWHRAACCS